MAQSELLKKGLLLAAQDTSVGQKCFENIANTLGTLLEVDYVLVGLLSDEYPDQVKTIALWVDGKIQPNLTYHLKGTPCETVVGQTMCIIADEVDSLFPDDVMLKDLGVKGYLGAPIFDMKNKGIGLLALMSRTPMIDTAERRSLIQINAARIGVEIDRMNYEEKLKQLNQGLELEVKKRTEKLEILTNAISDDLNEAELKYRMLFEYNTDALVMSDPGKLATFTAANKAAVTLFGAKDEAEVMQYGPVDLSPEYQPDGKLSSEKAFEMVNLGIKNGFQIFEWRHKKISGEEFDCNIMLTGIDIKGRKFIQASIRDITESKQAKEELIEKEIELEYAERVAKLGRWKWDVIKDKVEWSDIQKEIFGFKPSDEVPPYEKFEKLHTPESLQRLNHCVANAIENGIPYELDLEIILPDGSTKWIQGRGEVAQKNHFGKALVLVGTVQDISDRKKLENDLHDALKARDVFLGVASHELKTPLTTLQLQIHSLFRVFKGPVKDIPREKVVSKLEVIKRQGDRFEQLVKTLLDISQFSSGKLKLQTEKNMNLSELAEEISARYQDEFMHVGSEFKVSIEPDVRGDWDSQRLEQVITNLLSNALKYGAGKPVELIVRKNDLDAFIEVHDQGIGIAKNSQERIFERFERAVDEHSYKGLGLGLWIVREIVSSLKGEIWVESELGQGSSFITKLPLSAKPVSC